MIARIGAGVASYVAILGDMTPLIIPMMIFAVFALIAGGLVVFLPETKDQPLPETLRVSHIHLLRTNFHLLFSRC